ncbi:hypothetical protein PHJA_001935000 [Phtheirospermum japonicum]|uniref:B box-type domain-containing protein n=1 Tax=Phtheirospermum japonicum TaxID=374723 RepID=A0A830CFS7_9LAMI|nr:hypothetical protein PHJA_001935000 [Phtheirospermum japonicum]
MLESSEVPEWLSALLTEKFFNACIAHEGFRKNDKNVFCLDCCEGICPHCFAHHRSHRLLQIRRYVYNDVIRLVDADKLMDCAHVQSYTNNSAKVVFLKQRPQTRAPKISGNLCVTCDRSLQESSLYCSVYCKLEHIIGNGCELSMYLRKCEFLALPDPGLDDGQMTPDSVLESAGSTWTESGSSSGLTAGLIECPNLICTATTEVAKKKRSNRSTGFRPACKPVSDMPEECMMTRRKGTPQRSPLH